MAQPTQYIYDYLGGKSIKANDIFTSTDITTQFPTAKIVEMRTDNVKVSINGTDATTWMRGDVAYVNAGRTWVFLNDCEIAVATLVNLAV